MKKKILMFSIIIILFAVFGVAKEAKAGAGENVYGWAWSENIGWISFNNTTGGGSVNYGVNINSSTGLFSGYAWSENIGWVSFNSADLVGCPSGTCEARLNLLTREVSGWARVLANGDGWDGWIKLRGTWANGVSLNTAPTPKEFQGWAWGSDVVGWISFNRSNTGAASNYKVMTDLSVNLAPSANNLNITEGNYCNCASGQITQCSGSRSKPPIYLNWTFNDPGDTQSSYQIQIDNSGAEFPSPEIDTGKVSSSSGTYAPLGLNFNTQYWWRLKVWDSQNVQSDDWIYPTPRFFTTAAHRWPNTDFTPNPTNPPAGVEITFIDNSRCYTAAGGEYDCKLPAGAASYNWNFGDASPIDTTKGDTKHTYTVSGDYIVRLEVTDSMCPCVYSLTAALPLPTWKEITPF